MLPSRHSRTHLLSHMRFKSEKTNAPPPTYEESASHSIRPPLPPRDPRRYAPSNGFAPAQGSAPPGPPPLPPRNPSQSDSVAVPSGVTHGAAPFSVSKSWSSIRKKYAVQLSPVPSHKPDVYLKVSDGDIHTSLYLLGHAGRPARTELKASEGSIKLRVFRQPGQAVDIQAVTSEGKVSIFLPHDFCGPVTGHTKSGSVKVSPGLTPRAVLAPSPPGQAKRETRQTWLVAPIGMSAAQAQGGRDRVWAQTKNDNVKFLVEGEKSGDGDDGWEDVAEAVLGEVFG